MAEEQKYRKLELSANQRQFWFVEKIYPQNRAYNIPSVFHLKGALNKDILWKSIQFCVDRHEIFRTLFSEEEGVPYQRIYSSFLIEPEVIAVKDAGRAGELIEEEINRPFSLSGGPLLRVKLLELKEDEFYLVITMHHIITDLYTKDLFGEEVSAAYKTLIEGKEYAPEKVLFQYAHYTESQARWMASEQARKAADFWNEKLAERKTILDFPVDHSRPPLRDLTGDELGFTFPAELTKNLRSFCKKEFTDIFIVLLSVYTVLLYRYSRQEDIIIGVPLSNRRAKENKEVAGCLMNILPITPRISGALSFKEVISLVRRLLLLAHRNQELPFEDIVKNLSVARDPSCNPLFQYGFTFEHPMKLNLPGLETQIGEGSLKGAQLDLFLIIRNDGDTLRGKISFNTTLFSRSTIKRIARNFQILLGAALKTADEDIVSLTVSSPEEVQLIDSWNNTDMLYSRDRCIHHFLEEQARLSAGKEAVLFREESLSYEMLNGYSNRLSALLIEKGVCSGSIVGVFMDRSLEMCLALFAILKAGAAYLPLDPDYPEKRLSFILEDAKTALVVTRQDLKYKLCACSAPVLALGNFRDDLKNYSSENPAVPVSSDSLAYIIYTSGSTGNPKGVMIEHHSVVNRIEWKQKRFPLTENDVILQKTPFTFDVSVWELFWWSFYGAKVCFLPPGEEKLPAAIVKAVAKYGITVMHFVPSMLQIFLSRLKQEKTFNSLSSLRQVFASGEALLPVHVKTFKEWLYDTNKTKLANLYGPTEATVDVSCYECDFSRDIGKIPIGKPIDNIKLYIVDENMNPVPLGVPGELVIQGAGLARGYLNRPDLTEEKFVFSSGKSSERWYRTGDLARFMTDGNIEYLGRLDFQVKIRGFRIELEEIAIRLMSLSSVSKAVVIDVDGSEGEKDLAAFIQPVSYEYNESGPIIRELKKSLPLYMVPSIFVFTDEIPLTPNGKADRKKLLSLVREDHKTPHLFLSKEEALQKTQMVDPDYNTLETLVAGFWKELLHIETVSRNVNFFDAGGNSFQFLKLCGLLEGALNITVDTIQLFAHPTIRQMADYLERRGKGASPDRKTETAPKKRTSGEAGDIAVIGMACRFPGAPNVEAFWDVLKAGRETITHFMLDDLASCEYNFNTLEDDPNFVPARGMLEDIDKFDAAFFGFNPAEASIMDPQHRLWLETAWEAMERAGYGKVPEDNRYGVFAGSFLNNYLIYNLLRERGSIEDFVRLRGAHSFQNMINNHSTYLPTRTSYKMNLKGPSVNVQTACSTSLAAIVMAARSLTGYESDLCLAGGICIPVPQKSGYIYQEGAIPSKTGHCRPFDASADGTVLSSGVGIVVLKRLEDAQKDRDRILAVIKGGSLNNDGASKVSYMAPSIDGQMDVLLRAREEAGITAESLGYIEAHGTGTPLGDPIEIEALTRAFRQETGKKQFCAIGSVKSNIGHTDAAAGAAGFIKTVLALQHKTIPPTVHYQKSNPKINFQDSPFYVAASLAPWERDDTPRRAGVSSFGIGGTNVHLILEEAPEQKPSAEGSQERLYLFSGKTKNALEASLTHFKNWLNVNPQLNMTDAAYTLRNGRHCFNHRAFVAARGDAVSVANIIEENSFCNIGRAAYNEKNRDLVFMFPGQGSLYPGMGSDLYRKEPVFKVIVDRAVELANPMVQCDLKKLIFEEKDIEPLLSNNACTQLAIFIIEYALAGLWKSRGVTPAALTGHSLGEWTAACFSGIITLQEAIRILYHRGTLMEAVPEKGSAIAIRAGEEEARKYLSGKLALAAINSPNSCLISGPPEEVDQCIEALEKDKVLFKKLNISLGVHSALIEPALEPFREVLDTISFKAPQIPMISNVTGQWLTEDQALDPGYWTNHMREPVRFKDGISGLLEQKDYIFLEVGPGYSLAALVGHQLKDKTAIITCLELGEDEVLSFLKAAGKLWLNGLAPDWKLFYKEEKGTPVVLPTYPFERKRYWVEAPSPAAAGASRLFEDPKTENQDPVETPSLPELPLSDQEQLVDILKEIFAAEGGLDKALLSREMLFSDMGFDSIFLAHVALILEKRFNLSIKFRQLNVDYPNIDTLARHIMKKRPLSRKEIVKTLPGEGVKLKNLALYRTEGERIPFIMVHGDYSNKYLPGLLGKDQPYLGYFHQGADGEKMQFTQVEEIARFYIQELKQVRPKGPYVLGGFSFGGLVAYEMARQLSAEGAEIPLVVLVDTVHPQRQGFKHQVKHFSRLVKKSIGWLPLRIRDFILHKVRIPSYFKRSVPLPVKFRSEYILDTYEKSSRRYIPGTINIPLVIFKATESIFKREAFEAWEKQCSKEVNIYDLPGNHISIVNNPTSSLILAEKLKDHFEKVREDLEVRS